MKTMHGLRVVIFGLAVVATACGNSPAASESKPSLIGSSVSDAAPARDNPPAVDTEDFAASAMADAGRTAPAKSEPAHEAIAGMGSCNVDDDCVLTKFQEGCCVQACLPYASSARDLRARQAREDCEDFRARGGVCPPPAPCRAPRHRVVTARCIEQLCHTITEPLSP